MKNKILNALVIALILFQAVAPIGALAYTSTDQADYSPGSVVTIFGDNRDGAGYRWGETVHVDVSGPNGYTAACDGVADENGAWSCQVTLWDTYLAWGSYSYTATGQDSGVSQSGTFTDALNTGSYAADCITSQETFASDSTVCIRLTGLGNNASGTIKWWAPGLNPNTDIPTRTTNYGPVNGNTSDSYQVAACGTWNVRVTASSITGGSPDFDDTFVVTCNTTPSVTAPVNQSSNEGSSTSISLGSFADSDGGPWSVDVDWGDGSAHTTFNMAAAGAIPAQSHTYADGPNSYTVTVSVTDSTSLSGSNTFQVTVNNISPTANGNGPYSVNEGSSVGLSGSGSDLGADTLSYNWDLDNDSTFETPGQNATFSAVALDGPDSQTVVLQVCDEDGSCATSSDTVDILNVAPTATFSSPDVNEGNSMNLSLTSPVDVAADSATLQYAFDCGDGAGYGAFSSTNSATCPTTDNGSRSVKGQIKDKDGGVTEYTDTVTINNVAPTATFNASTPVDEGSAISLSLSSPVDVAADLATLQYAFDCDDGSGYGAFSATNSATCPTDDGPDGLTVKGQIKDKDGGIREYTASVSVDNVAPTATFNAPASVDEGSDINLSLTDPYDPSSADSTTGFQYAFDCDDGSGFAALNGANTATCPTTDDGTRSVAGKIQDKDDGSSTYSGSVTINNVSPTVTLSGPDSANEGQTNSYSYTTSDPGTETFSHTADCGANGTLSNDNFNPATGVGSFDCTFPDGPASSTVSVTVDDGDGGSDSDSIVVSIANVSPTVTLSGPNSADEGQTKSYSYTTSDPGTETFSHTTSCGANGTLSDDSFNTATGAGSFDCTFPDGPASSTVSVSVDDGDGGSDDDSISVSVANVAPTVTLTGSSSANEGDTNTYTYTTSDPGAETFSHTASCGANGTTSNDNFNAATGAGSFKCTFPDGPANSTVSISVDDGDGGSDDDSIDASVANVAPVVTVSGPSSADEGDTKSYSYTTSDPGAETFSHTADCGANGTLSNDGFNSATGAGSFNCTFPDGPASSTVSISVNDGDGGGDSDTIVVTVANAAPTVVAGFTGSSLSCRTTATLGIDPDDLGMNDNPWKVNINWGDGNTEAEISRTNLNPFSVTHVYTLPGSYDATVSVTDKDGQTGYDSTNPITINQTYTANFLQPLDGSTASNSITNTMKSGRVVPVKVTIYDDCTQAYVTDPATLVRINVLASGSSAANDAVEIYADAGAANNNTLLFRWTSDASAPGGGFWIYNLDSKTVLNGQPMAINTTYHVDVYLGSVKATTSKWALLKPVR